MPSIYDRLCVSQNNLLIFLHIDVHIGMFHSHVAMGVNLL